MLRPTVENRPAPGTRSFSNWSFLAFRFRLSNMPGI
jgi:hypothetical protein